MDGVAGVQPFIELQPDQSGVAQGGQGAGDLGLADPRRPFQQQGTFQHQRQMQRHGQIIAGHTARRRKIALKTAPVRQSKRPKRPLPGQGEAQGSTVQAQLLGDAPDPPEVMRHVA